MTRDAVKIELNGFNWISLDNEKKESNSIRKCEIRKVEKKDEISISLEGASKGVFCLIRYRKIPRIITKADFSC